MQAILCGVLFFLIILGAGVRIADAGLACPDWPFCFGELIPPFNFQIFMEWIHRVIAGSVGLLQLAIAVWVFSKPHLRKLCGYLVGLSLILFAVQANLGRQTVTELLNPKFVNSHLMGGYLLLAANLWILHRLTRVTMNCSIQSGKILLIESSICLVLIFLQATVGGTVSSHYAGLVCPDFPTCQGQWIPELTGLVAVKFFHRWGGFVLLAISILMATSIFKRAEDRKLQKIWIAICGLICVQIGIGIGMIYTLIHPGLALLHAAVSVSLFTLFVVSHFRLRKAVCN